MDKQIVVYPYNGTLNCLYTELHGRTSKVLRLVKEVKQRIYTV